MSIPLRGVWRHPDFVKLWVGQATSMFGSLIGGFAYSLVAIMSLNAGPAQIAVLNGCSLVPGLIAGPWVGVLADRTRHRPLLIAADLARALALGSIPLTAVMHMLTMGQLYAVAATVSLLTMLFDVSFRAYVPVLLGREGLIEGNSALQGTAAVAEAGGFAAAGLLVQAFTAPVAILFDAISFLLSSLSLATISTRSETKNERHHSEERRSLRDIAEGARTVWTNRTLRALTLTECVAEVTGQPIGVVIMLFFIHDLHLAPSAMGPIFGIGGISAFLGAVLCTRIIRRWGLGHALIGGMYFNSIGLLAIVVAGGPLPLVVFLMAAAQATDGGRTVYEIGVTTLIQSEAPQGMVGRVFATYETLRSTAMVLGLLVGAVLGQLIGLRPVLILALAASMLVPLCLVFSPVRHMRENAAQGVAASVAV